MKLHSILVRQIAKYLGDAESIPSKYKDLFVAISDTYSHYDEDHKLLERSLELSSNELHELISELKATLDSTSDGILVVNLHGKITGYNKRFVEMWKIPPKIMDSQDDDKAIAFVLSQLKDPESFEAKVRELYKKPKARSQDVIEFKDGRVFERLTLPQQVGSSIIGRIWSFHDTTKSVKNEQVLQKKVVELEKLNRFMVDRELKMIELKKTIKALQSDIDKLQQIK